MVSCVLFRTLLIRQLTLAGYATLFFARCTNRLTSLTGHVNNIMYNRYAESGRVNWITSFAGHAPPDQRQQWVDIMSPRGVGLILKSIRTDYKLVSSSYP
jgi:hypothetical protein